MRQVPEFARLSLSLHHGKRLNQMLRGGGARKLSCNPAMVARLIGWPYQRVLSP